MDGKFKKSAIWYQKQGFSVIPIRPNKKPFVAWEKYQTEPATEDQINKWWDEHPRANIGLVCGEVSGVMVIDADSDAGRDAIEEFLPDTVTTPIVKTPHGHHFYFKYRHGLSNGVRVLTDTDFRTDGGYVIAPPSRNGSGEGYRWTDGLDIAHVKPAPMPPMLFDVLQQGAARDSSALSKAHLLNKGTSLYNKKTPSIYSDNNTTDNKRQHLTTSDNIPFSDGRRDDDLFHVANTMIKGGADPQYTRQVLETIANTWGETSGDKSIKRWLDTKIDSVLKRASKRERNLTQEVRDYILTTSGNFLTTDVYQVTTFDNIRAERKKVCVILGRFAEEGFIERVGTRNGCYRRVENKRDAIDWESTSTEPVRIWLPFELGTIANIHPGDIVLFMGSPNAGKTALALNIAKENRHAFKAHYFSSEMGAAMFKKRIRKFVDANITADEVKFYEQTDNFQDVIEPGEGNLNIIDYLEVHDKFYLVGEKLAAIHEKLDGAIAVIAVQKDFGRDFGRGGSFLVQKPSVAVSIEGGTAKCMKIKDFNGDNPNGKQYHFKLVDGCRLIETMGWHRGEIEI